MSTPAGWYPDPQAEGQQRYWDGNAWTQHQAPLVQQQPTQPTEPVWTAPQQGVASAAAPMVARQTKPFWRRTWVLVTAATVIVLGGIGAASGSGDKTDTSAHGSHHGTAQRDKASDTVGGAIHSGRHPGRRPVPVTHQDAGADEDEQACSVVHDQPGAGHRLGQGLPGLLRLLAGWSHSAAVVEVRRRVQPGRCHLRGQPHHRGLECAGGQVGQGLLVDVALLAGRADPATVVSVRRWLHAGAGDLRREPRRALTRTSSRRPGAVRRAALRRAGPSRRAAPARRRSGRAPGPTSSPAVPGRSRRSCRRSRWPCRMMARDLTDRTVVRHSGPQRRGACLGCERPIICLPGDLHEQHRHGRASGVVRRRRWPRAVLGRVGVDRAGASGAVVPAEDRG